MWTCPRCREEVDDGFEVCWSCGTAIDGTEDPDFQPADAERGGEEPAPPPASTEAAAQTSPPDLSDPDPSLPPEEYLRALISRLSVLIDSHDVPGWTINPAYHPAVAAFIGKHANNSVFLAKAEALQKNRASYFATMRAKSQAAPPAATEDSTQPEPEAPAEAVAEAPPAATPSARRRFLRWPPISGRFVKRWLKRLLKIAAVLLLVLFTLAYIGRQYWKKIGQDRLDAAIAEADRLDPGWRWEQLQARRKPVPDEENGALVVLAVLKMLPESWAVDEPVFESITWETEPNVTIDPETVEQLDRALQKHRQALQEARKLIHYSTGRYPDIELKEVFRTEAPWLKPMGVGSLLHLQAELLCATGHPDEAVRTAHCALAAACSYGEAPDLLAFLCRIAARHMAVLILERALGHGEARDESLLGFQSLLQQEMSDELMVYNTLRRERALQHHMWTALAANDPSQVPPDIQEMIGELIPQSTWGKLVHWFLVGGILENHASALQSLAQFIDVARLPVDDRLAKYDSVHAEFERTKAESYRQMFGKLTAAGSSPAIGVSVRGHAYMRCTRTAIAAERYRLAEGRWPETLEQLTPRYLTEVPRDPFDGQPIRYRRLDDGVVIYSVGRDREDNGGRISRAGLGTDESDLGFRLWDVAHRRKPAMP